MIKFLPTLTVKMYQPSGAIEEGKLVWTESKRFEMASAGDVMVSILY